MVIPVNSNFYSVCRYSKTFLSLGIAHMKKRISKLKGIRFKSILYTKITVSQKNLFQNSALNIPQGFYFRSCNNASNPDICTM